MFGGSAHSSGGGRDSGSVFDSLPSALLPPRPSLEDKAPKTAKAFRDMVFDWLEHDPSFYSSIPTYKAVHAYCTKAAEYADLVGPAAALRYHYAAIEAARRRPPLFDPLRDGDTYALAYSMHICGPRPPPSGSSRLAKGVRPSGKVAGIKRASAPDSSVTTGDCDIHPGKGHTNAQCNAQRPRGKKAKSDTSSASTGGE